MTSSSPEVLASASSLLASEQSLLFLDATLTLKASELDGPSRYAQRHILGARFFDLNQVCDQGSPLPRMMPSSSQLASVLRQLEIGPEQQVVVYDQDGLYSAPRAWWMLRCAGHRAVRVLDGGIEAWIAAGGAVTTGLDPAPPLVLGPSDGACGWPDRVADHAQVAKALLDPGAVVLDVRSAGRFRGELEESNPALKSGHMPGAINLPYSELVGASGTLVSKAELDQLLQARGLDARQERQWISSCGSGVTACVFALAMAHHHAVEVQIYDGSWSEWGRGEVGEIVSEATSCATQ